MPIPAVYAMIIAVLLGLGFSGGWSLSSKIAAGNLMQCEMDAQIAYTEQERYARERADLAAQSNERALVYVMQRITDAEQQSEELRNEIKKHTTGRDCITADARRVLQQSKAFAATTAANRVPANTASAAATNAAPATDPGHGHAFTRMSTDTDISDWSVTVAGLYDQCRERLEAIKLWDAGLESNGRH